MTGHSKWHISAVEVKAFKSFNGKPWARFDVSDGFVGILGPNGSGKSNLLEAVCFATGCSSTMLRGCRTLKDVTSTDARSQLPGVKLEISCGKGSRAEHHLLEASLTPEGTRAYKIDGRIKTGTQVKDCLKSCGIVVDPTTVIKQASVTRLTDSNNPATLAELVSAASGLASWDQETAAARQEILRTRKALKDIQTNISRIQSAAAADEAAVQASLEASRLERELEHALEMLVAGMQQRKDSLQQQLTAAQDQEQQMQAAADSLTDCIQQTKKQKHLLQTQQAQILADMNKYSSSAASSNLAGQIAAAESKVAVLQATAAASSNLTSNLASCKQQLVQQESKVQVLEAILQAKLKVAGEAKAGLAAVELSSSAADSLQQQLLHTQKQAASAATAVIQQQATVVQCADIAQQARNKVAAAEDILQSLPAVPTAATGQSTVSGATAAVQSAAAAAHEQQQTVTSLQQHLLQLQMNCELLGAQLINPQTAALLASCSSSAHGTNRSNSSSSSATPLHACFRFKPAVAAAGGSGQSVAAQQQQQQVLIPLSTIARPGILQVLVANSIRDANTLLAATAAAAGNRPGSRGSSSNLAGKLKIWPLDNLRYYNNLPAQRAAQQQLGHDKVTIPLDLFDYDPKYESAMIRAFGGFVIAADDATAAQLVQKYGISSVTLQGTVSKKGSMSGGWTGSSGGFAKQFWSNKLQSDATAAEIAAVSSHLQQEMAKQQQLEQSRLQAEQNLSTVQQRTQAAAALHELEAAATAAAERLQQQQQQLISLQQQQAETQTRLQQCREAADDTASKGGAKAAAAAAMRRQLKDDAAKAAAAVQEIQQQLDAARDEVEQLSVQVETLEMQLTSSDSAEQQQEQLQQQQQHLQQLLQQQQKQEAAAVQLQEQCKQLQQQLAVLDQETSSLQQQQSKLQQQLKEVAATAAAASADLKQLEAEVKQLRRDFPDSDVVHGLNHSTAIAQHDSSSNDTNRNGDVPTGKQIHQMLKKAKQLQQQIMSLEVPELPAAQKELCESRVQQVLQFQEQMAALAAAADGLEERISSTSAQVQSANDAVYEDIAAGFTQLCNSLLPALEVQLERAAELAHEGLRFRFRRLEDAAAASISSADEWRTSLGQLSGGQQTLVSLAMLLAVARAGSSSRLFLLDEVDAALDEHNQARAAALLKQLANSAEGGCQILCVTHNSAFQQVCDAYVQVVRGADGGTLPAGGAAVEFAATDGADSNRKRSAAAGQAGGNAAGGARRKAGTGGAAGAVRARGGSAGGTAKKVRFET